MVIDDIKVTNVTCQSDTMSVLVKTYGLQNDEEDVCSLLCEPRTVITRKCAVWLDRDIIFRRVKAREGWRRDRNPSQLSLRVQYTTVTSPNAIVTGEMKGR